ncbi:MAG TPA: GNAT family N-acetyltransferase [Kofleriaceae bacterium]|nr:GNAT family N-acetyltransferase [Kofleriaceae bacterium]
MLVGWTERLALEPLAQAHAEGLVAALGHAEVARHLPAPDVTTVEALRERIAHLQRDAPAGEVWLNFAVRRRVGGDVIGRIEATRHRDWAEVAYLVGPAYQRRGYATEAVGWLVERLAASGAGEVWASVQPANAASRALLARLGFVEGEPGARPLGSYDPGDVVFVRGAG